MSNEMIQRQEKARAMRAAGGNPYPNGFEPTHSTGEIHARFGPLDAAALAAVSGEAVRVAGRIRFWNDFGKSTFIRVADRSGVLQVFVRVNKVGEEGYARFKDLDVGDFVAVTGALMRTRTGELTVEASEISLLTKTVRPLPEKWHGLSDLETRYRQRYVDLMVNEGTREVFRRRTATVKALRRWFDAHDFLEVETPMMHPIAGGAAARPFVTHHNALGMPLYMRVAPELYLKRLVVGGLERVYEINRNFRNEGISVRHNPEFTMLEFYRAYATVEDLVSMSEALFSEVTREVTGGTVITYQGREVDLTPPFRRYTLQGALVELGGLTPDQSRDAAFLRGVLAGNQTEVDRLPTLGHLQLAAFEVLAEPRLWQPTFITDYPVEVSPLARRRDDDPSVTERFELFVAGLEVANGFSELNDPEDQRERFLAQAAAKAAGDEEATEYDADYIRALEYGLPPTAGEGIGVDRLVMLLTDSASIRDVILFPLMRPEHGTDG